jgi:hypothetical protein
MREKNGAYIINFLERVYLALGTPVEHSVIKIIEEDWQH